MKFLALLAFVSTVAFGENNRPAAGDGKELVCSGEVRKETRAGRQGEIETVYKCIEAQPSRGNGGAKR